MIDSYSLNFPATHSVRNKKAVKNLSVRGDESGRPVGRTKCHGIHTQALHAEGIISLPSQMPDATAEKNEDRGVRSPWMERELGGKGRRWIITTNLEIEIANLWTKDGYKICR